MYVLQPPLFTGGYYPARHQLTRDRCSTLRFAKLAARAIEAVLASVLICDLGSNGLFCYYYSDALPSKKQAPTTYPTCRELVETRYASVCDAHSMNIIELVLVRPFTMNLMAIHSSLNLLFTMTRKKHKLESACHSSTSLSDDYVVVPIRA